MFIFLLLIFILLLTIYLLGNIRSSSIKLTDKQKKHLLDAITVMLAGFVFVVITELFQSGQKDYGSFSFGSDIFYNYDWSIGRDRHFWKFFYSSIIVYLIIWLKREYTKSK
mgnify:CR=1 FL=1